MLLDKYFNSYYFVSYFQGTYLNLSSFLFSYYESCISICMIFFFKKKHIHTKQKEKKKIKGENKFNHESSFSGLES